ncbi:MAG: CinA family protein [Pseudomonadota bacterium]
MQDLAKQAFDALKNHKAILATAESCTGGMIAAAITDFSGSSEIFDRGFVTYSNQAKMDLLAVKTETLEMHGAVSEQTAQEMAEGALQNSLATIAISVTGIAGPTGGSPEKPVGLVYMGLALKDQETKIFKLNFDGDRHAVRVQTRGEAFKQIVESLKS